ncbi:MAG: type II toxin-antitoxin system VapC family toxin [Rhizobiaceae bacterium]|nr:type II toxin-antitoxin system VapC family toxin [Rhizobiaceae bacterium]
MFVDASALVAILKGEEERDLFSRRITEAARLITSPISIFEAAMAFVTMTGNCAAATNEVYALLETLGIVVVPIEESAAMAAAIARDQYGKGTGHPAQLNLGDCISYALAKQNAVKLLYKGRDFAQTDLA